MSIEADIRATNKLKDQNSSHVGEFMGKSLVMENILEEGAIKFKMMPTLQHIAAVKVATRILFKKFTEKEFLSINLQNLNYILKPINETSNIIIKEFDKLFLPVTILPRLIFVAKSISFELAQWIAFHTYFPSRFEYQKYVHLIQWTTRGRIDYPKTGMMIYDSQKCLEPNVKDMLERLYEPLDDEAHFKRVYSILLTPEDYFTFSLISNPITRSWLDMYRLWHYYLPKIRSIDKFKNSLRHIWRGLDEDSKSNLFAMSFYPVDVMFCILSDLSAKEQMSELSTYPNFGYLFVDWLWQDFFFVAYLQYFQPPVPHFSNLANQLMYYAKGSLHPEKHRKMIVQILEGNVDLLESLSNSSIDFIHSLRINDAYKPLQIHLLSRFLYINLNFVYFFEKLFQLFIGERDELILKRELQYFREVIFVIKMQRYVHKKFDANKLESSMINLLFDVENLDILQEIINCLVALQKVLHFDKKIALTDSFNTRAYGNCVMSASLTSFFERFDLILNFVFSNKQKIKLYRNTQFLSKNNENDQPLDIKFRTYFVVSEPTKPWEKLKEILDWCFRTEEQIQNFKTSLIDSSSKKKYPKLTPAVVQFLTSFDVAFTANLVNWCFSSDESQINNYKYHLSKYLRTCVAKHVRVSISKMPGLMDWLNPYGEILVN